MPLWQWEEVQEMLRHEHVEALCPRRWKPVAKELRRTEADIELALRSPCIQERNIVFVPESRTVRMG